MKNQIRTDQSQLGGTIKAEDFQIEDLVLDEDSELDDTEIGDDDDLDADEFDAQGLAPMEDTPSSLRARATELVQIDNLAEEIDLSDEQMDPGEMNEDDARESGYLDAEETL